jgi:hypothetical protein
MNRSFIGRRFGIRREGGTTNLLTSLVAFAVSVMVTRVFLELTGYPQIGNSVLHIAHALWGGLLLIVASILPLILAGGRVLHLSALLGGVGVGLFIDEIGKFITQANDYFFPPSLSLIYGFFLLGVLLYVIVRREQKIDDRQAVSYALEGLGELLQGELDNSEADVMIRNLEKARRSQEPIIAELARVLGEFLQRSASDLPSTKRSLWGRVTAGIDGWGKRLGRKRGRLIVVLILCLWLAIVTGFIVILLDGSFEIVQSVVRMRWLLVGIQGVVGLLMVSALMAMLLKRERYGLNLGIAGFLFSLVALQLLYFYISQFSAITSTLVQFCFLMFFLVYRRRYLAEEIG